MGAHADAALVRPPYLCFLLFRILSLLAITYIGRPVLGITEAEALLKFKSSLTHQEGIPNWNPSSSPCSEGRTANWVGVICENGEVWGLQLENMGLGGTIDINALSQLPKLRTLSFKNNKFEGAIPDFQLLPKLRSIYLTNNQFSGEIPDNAFDGMVALRRVVLTHNAFTGKIPSSLGKLPILVELKLDSNQFQGSIPEFQQKELPNINLANNQLEGPLPFTKYMQETRNCVGALLIHALVRKQQAMQLYNELPSLTVPHGYLKSSNVLLNDSYEPLLMDYALKPLINPEHAKKLMVAYKSPEYTQHGNLTKKTDVWSLGILILEVLTGKFPANFLALGNVKGENIVAWVNEIASADIKGEDVFDKEMKGTHHSKVEMRKLLKVGFRCCHEDVDVRWSIKVAVEKIEEVNETDNPD